ncbi:MAG: PilZ domain-containing protein [Desulforhopalus sp.]
MQKVYLEDNNVVTVSCPKCKKTRKIDATPYLKKEGLVQLTFRFKCNSCDCGHKDCSGCNGSDCSNGHSNSFILERRKFYRKKVNLSGSIIGNSGKRYSIRVRDLSRTGLKMKVLSPHAFQVDERILVEFFLDDVKETQINKEVVIRKTDDKEVDGEFLATEGFDNNDKIIGFYLMN